MPNILKKLKGSILSSQPRCWPKTVLSPDCPGLPAWSWSSGRWEREKPPWLTAHLGAAAAAPPWRCSSAVSRHALCHSNNFIKVAEGRNNCGSRQLGADRCYSFWSSAKCILRRPERALQGKSVKNYPKHPSEMARSATFFIWNQIKTECLPRKKIPVNSWVLYRHRSWTSSRSSIPRDRPACITEEGAPSLSVFITRTYWAVTQLFFI